MKKLFKTYFFCGERNKFPCIGIITKNIHLKGYLFLIGLAIAITLTNQIWVASTTIYSENLVEKREAAHKIILNNKLPIEIKTWSEIGANGVNIRILTIFGVEYFHKLTGFTLEKSYRFIETASVFICCLLLFYYLSLWCCPLYALIGLLYFGSILPLTYFFHIFHPWDKPSLIFWLLSIILIYKDKLLVLIPVLFLGILVKYDIILLPILYFLGMLHKKSLQKNLFITIGLLLMTIGTYLTLRIYIPGGFETRHINLNIYNNIKTIADMKVSYPPLLALGLPFFLALFGFFRANEMAKSFVLFCFIQSTVLFILTNFVEFRAEMPLLVLLMPSALTGLKYLLIDIKSSKAI